MSLGKPEPPHPATTPIGERYRHLRSGTVYEILLVGVSEKTLTPVIIYREATPGYSTVWVRDYAEFFDGRFEVVDE